MAKSRFDGAKCEACGKPLGFHPPSGVTVSAGEQVDVSHEPPWCAKWSHPLTRERCIPRAILDECMKEPTS